MIAMNTRNSRLDFAAATAAPSAMPSAAECTTSPMVAATARPDLPVELPLGRVASPAEDYCVWWLFWV